MVMICDDGLRGRLIAAIEVFIPARQMLQDQGQTACFVSANA